LSAVLVAWGGPLPILTIFLIIFWRRLKILQKLAFIALVYIISIATGILSDVVWQVGNYPSAMIAGIVAPIVYCSVFSAISLRRYSGAEQKTVPAAANQWKPIIVAAIIQVTGTIIAALIIVLVKK